MALECFDFSFRALGGSNLLKFFAESEERASDVSESVIAEVARIEQKYSRYRTESVLSQVNRAAGGDALEVDDETAALLDYAAICFEQSTGLFDITSGVLRRVWDFESGKLPEDDVLQEVLSLIGWDKVSWEKPFFSLPRPGMEIDFGGVGKEYAVDCCAALLLEQGIRHGFINLSGDLQVVGPRPDGSPWIVGIQHPRREKEMLAGVKVFQGALATSGDYERYMEIAGERFCHILNPQSGWPVQDLQAVTVQAESCLVAGSVATIAMLYGEKRGRKYLKENQVPHLLVNGAGELSCFPHDLLGSESRECYPTI